MYRPFRAKVDVIQITQGVAPGWYVMPRWGFLYEKSPVKTGPFFVYSGNDY